MYPLVHVQVVLLTEALVTHGALVRLLARVRPIVSIQVVFLAEFARANVALERLLARVRPKVDAQLLSLTERSTADVTLELLVFGDSLARRVRCRERFVGATQVTFEHGRRAGARQAQTRVALISSNK